MAALSVTFDRLKKIVSTLRREPRSEPDNLNGCAEDVRTRADRFYDIFRSLTFPRLDGEKKRRTTDRTPVADEG